MNKYFRKFAETVAFAVGTSWAFMIAITIIVVWAAMGPFFGFGQQWQLVINSFTTVVTFLVVFIIQNTQNRDFRILQLKLTELMRVSGDSLLMNVERFSDNELTLLERALEEFEPPRRHSEILKELASEKERRKKAARSRPA